MFPEIQRLSEFTSPASSTSSYFTAQGPGWLPHLQASSASQGLSFFNSWTPYWVHPHGNSSLLWLGQSLVSTAGGNQERRAAGCGVTQLWCSQMWGCGLLQSPLVRMYLRLMTLNLTTLLRPCLLVPPVSGYSLPSGECKWPVGIFWEEQLALQISEILTGFLSYHSN